MPYMCIMIGALEIHVAQSQIFNRSDSLPTSIAPTLPTTHCSTTITNLFATNRIPMRNLWQTEWERDTVLCSDSADVLGGGEEWIYLWQTSLCIRSVSDSLLCLRLRLRPRSMRSSTATTTQRRHIGTTQHKWAEKCVAVDVDVRLTQVYARTKAPPSALVCGLTGACWRAECSRGCGQWGKDSLNGFWTCRCIIAPV